MYTSFLRSSFHKQLKWLWSQWVHLQDILASWGLPGRAGRDIFMEAYSHLQRQRSPCGTSFPRFMPFTEILLLLDIGHMPYGEPVLQLTHMMLCLGSKRRPVKDLCLSSFLVVCSHAPPPHSHLLLVNHARECQVSPGPAQHLTHTILFNTPKNQPGFLSCSLSHTC